MYGQQNDNDSFPLLPVPPKKKQQKPTDNDFPILKKKEVGSGGSLLGADVGALGGLSTENKINDNDKKAIAQFMAGGSSQPENNAGALAGDLSPKEITGGLTQVNQTIPSDKDITQKALERFQNPSFVDEMNQPSMRGLSDEDPIGNFVSKQERDKEAITATNKNSETYKIASQRIEKSEKIKKELGSSSTIEEAAAKHFGQEKENSFSTSQYIQDPDVIELANRSPELQKRFKEAKHNLYSNDPKFAQSEVRSKIAQAREDLGMNSLWANNPSAGTTDELVQNLLKAGKTPDGRPFTYQDAQVYQDQLRPLLELFHNAGGGSGIIPTTGAAESFGEGLNQGIEGIGSSLRDISNKATGGVFKKIGLLENDDDRKKRLLEEDKSLVSVVPRSDWARLISGSSHMVGYFSPMIAGSFIGIPSIATNTLMFEGQNADNALRLFDDPTKRTLYTIAGTGIDVGLAELLPTKKAAGNIKSALQKDIASVISDFTEKKITGDVAKKTILDAITQKFATIGKIGVNLAKENTRTASVMTGFGVIHNALDAAFGGRDVSLDDVVNQAMRDFKTNWLSSTGISAMAVAKSGNRTNGKIIREIVEHPDQYEDAIKNTGNEEIINNFKLATEKWKEISQMDLSDPQKEKMLIASLAEDIHKNKQSSISSISEGNKAKAIELAAVQKSILSGEDNAMEHERDVPEDSSLLGQLQSKTNGAGEKDADLQYFIDKASEDPKAFKERFGDELTTKVIEQIPTDKLEESHKKAVDLGLMDAAESISKILDERQPEEKKVAVILPSENKISHEDFTNHIIEQVKNVKAGSRGFDFIIDMPGLDQKTREGAISDIENGKQTKRREQFEQAIKSMHDKGVVSVARGYGNNAESVDIPFDEYFSNEGFDNKHLEAAEKIEDFTTSIINQNGITLDNISQLEHLFNGFPYDKSDLEAVKSDLAGQGERLPQSTQAGKESKSIQKEIIPSAEFLSTEKLTPEEYNNLKPEAKEVLSDKYKNFEKNEKLKEAWKPELKLNFVSAQDLVNSKDPLKSKEAHSAIKENFKKLKQLADCLFA
jgi:hypothetical protein